MTDNLVSLINKALEEKEYRPVVVGIVKDALGRILFVQSAKNLNEWYFPQGGIELNESPESALVREIGEETGILSYQLTNLDFKGWEDLNAESTRKDKRGYTKGKRYFFFTALYRGPVELKIDTKELHDYRWVNPAEISGILTRTRNDKKLLMLKFIAV